MVETNRTSQAFEAFFERWMIRLEHFLEQSMRAIQGEENHHQQRPHDLIHQIITHYAQYFEEKSKVVEENVFLVLTPSWFSSFEKSYLWIGGFKPGLAFRLLNNNVFDLTDDQSQRINRLLSEIRDEEKEIMEEFDRVQQRMVSPALVGLSRHLGDLRNGAANDVDSILDRLKVSMEALVECADSLRMKTALLLLEILKPTQAVRFLAAVAQLQLRLHRWGIQRDSAAYTATQSSA